MLVAHGRGEHGARYERFADELTPRGFACGAFDFRGFGHSAGPRGHIDSFSDYLDDLDTAVAAASELAASAPLFLLGHSMGGLAALRWAQTRNTDPQQVAGLILSGPFLRLPSPPTGLKLAALRLISKTSPQKVIEGSGKPATRDEAWLELKKSDPLQVAAPTARWITECMAAHAAAAEAGDPGIPVLTLQGGADVSTDPVASRTATEACAQGTYNEYPDLLHEVLNELPDDRARVIADTLTWLEAQAS